MSSSTNQVEVLTQENEQLKIQCEGLREQVNDLEQTVANYEDEIHQ